MTTTPAHLLPTSCYVCGSTEDHGATFDLTGQGHNFWANADAKAYFDAQVVRVTYPDGTTTPETHFVNQTRGI